LILTVKWSEAFELAVPQEENQYRAGWQSKRKDEAERAPGAKPRSINSDMAACDCRPHGFVRAKA
jgi:hypothetical protein